MVLRGILIELAFIVQVFTEHGVDPTLLSGSASALSDVSSIPEPYRAYVIRAFVMAIDYVWYISCASGCIAFLFTLLLKPVTLSPTMASAPASVKEEDLEISTPSSTVPQE